MEEFQEGHGDTNEDEHSVSSIDGRTIKEDYPSFEGHAVSMRPRLQGWLGCALALDRVRLQKHLSGEYTNDAL